MNTTGDKEGADQSTALFHFLLECGDDHLILGHRLSEWCGHAPMLEEDIALSNIALDCLGAASLLLEEAGRIEQAGRDADRLAFFREAVDFRNCLLVEQPNGDFAQTMMRQLFFDAYANLLFESLQSCAHEPLAAIAGKVLKEARYHYRHSAAWIIRLGGGTEESRSRCEQAIAELGRFTGALFEASAAAQKLSSAGIVPDVAELQAPWQEQIAGVFIAAGLPPLEAEEDRLPEAREGIHSEHLGHLLSELQITARSFPGAKW